MARQSKEQAPEHEISWEVQSRRKVESGEWKLTLETSEGNINARLFPSLVPAAACGAVWLSGGSGGLVGPANGLYQSACRLLAAKGITGLCIEYRTPENLQECIIDTLIGTTFLESEDVYQVALIGHSMGGAVAITAGAVSDNVKAVVALATQSAGTNLAPQLAPRSLLLVHGTADEILPVTCSEHVYEIANQPKTLKLFKGATHGLGEVRQELLELLTQWIPKHLECTW